MIQQDPGPRMVDVLGGGEEDHRPGVGHLDEMDHYIRSGCLSQLGPVAATELLEAIDLMSVPAAKLGAGSHVLEPFVDARLTLPHPTRPETVDEDPVPGRAGVLINTMDLERDRSSLRLEPQANREGKPLMTTTTLDLRDLAPKERHKTIFEPGGQGFRHGAVQIDEETWRVTYLRP